MRRTTTRVGLGVAIALGWCAATHAQTAIPQFTPAGPALRSGTDLNRLVNAINNLQGNGTASAVVGTTGAFSGNVTVGGTLGVTGVATFTGVPILPSGGATFGSTTITAAEIGVLDAVTPGTAAASKALVANSSTGIAGIVALSTTGLNSLAGKIATGSTPPVLTGCGTSPAIVGSDTAGTVTMGTGTPTGCTITFAAAYAAVPHCAVSWQATPLAAQSYAVTGAAITLTQTATSSNVVNYVCIARAGG